MKQLSKGVRLANPGVSARGVVSIGDAHFAQGDGECCGTAIEMCATFHLEFQVRKGVAAQRNIREVQFARDDYYGPPELIAPRRFHATTGMSIDSDGTNRSEDATLAARNALLDMIDYLVYERGLSRQQAYALASVAVDLKLSELVDVPNFVVSAFLPLDIFVSRAVLVVLVRGVHGGAALELDAVRVQDGFQAGQHLQHRFAAGVGAHRADAPHLPAADRTRP